MALKVIKAGLQSTLQGAPYRGHRHLGMPAAGAADCLSLALANRLVGKAPGEIAMELTLDNTVFSVDEPHSIAIIGAASYLHINDIKSDFHKTTQLQAGDKVEIGPAKHGCRSYLAISGQLPAEEMLGGWSTYLAARLGGFQGRALNNGDILEVKSSQSEAADKLATPANLRPNIPDNLILRATTGPEFEALSENGQAILFSSKWTISLRSDRMGAQLQRQKLELSDQPELASAAVFPGTIQCPPDGQPFLLGPDAQTAGGYPRIAQIIRADRHLIGQLRPGSQIQLVRVSPDRATEIYREKQSLLRPWLGSIELW